MTANSGVSPHRGKSAHQGWGVQSVLFGPTRKLLLVLTITWSIVALLELIQDLIGIPLTSGYIDIPDIFIFKLFWLLFIPANFILIKGIKSSVFKYSKSVRYVLIMLLVLLIGVLHLFLFALILSAYSGIVHSDPWSVGEMIVLKLTSRFYIVMAVNGLIGMAGMLAASRVRPAPRYKNIIPVKTGRKSRLVQTCDIRYIGTDQGYVSVYTNGTRYLISRSLSELANELDPQQFQRVHKSTIVNMDQVLEFRSRLNGDYDIIMNDGTQLRLSRNYAHSLKGTWL